MRIYDLLGSVFWLSLAVYVCIESFRLGIGTARNPGMGFMTFGASVFLGTLSIAVLVRTFLEKKRHGMKVSPSGALWQRVLWVTLTLLIYSRVMPALGYLLSTFILMILLFGIVRKMRWHWVVLSSFLTTIATYYLFSKWLNCQFPDGLFGL